MVGHENCLPASFSHLTGSLAIGKQIDDGLGQGVGISMRDSETCLAILDECSESFDLGHDRWYAARHRHLERAADGRDDRGLAVNVQDVPEVQADWDLVGKGQPLGDPEPLGSSPEIPFIVPVTGDEELGVEARINHLPRGIEQRGEARTRREWSGRADDRNPTFLRWLGWTGRLTDPSGDGLYRLSGNAVVAVE